MQPQLMYITEVLGINEFISVPGVKVDGDEFTGEFLVGTQNSKIIFLTTVRPNQDQQTMVAKMAAALKTDDYALAVIEPENLQISMSVLSESSGRKIILFGGEEGAVENMQLQIGEIVENGLQSQTVLTHSLSALTNKDHAYLQQMKKQTWDHLKSLFS